MIVVRQSFLHPTATQGHTLWLHNLYVVASGGLASNSSAMLEWAGARTLEAGAPAPSKTDPGVNRLWITSSVLEGDRVSTSAAVIDDAAYLAGVACACPALAPFQPDAAQMRQRGSVDLH